MIPIYIVDSKERWLNIVIATFVTGVLIYMTLTASSLLTSIDSLSQGILTDLSFNHPLLNHIFLVIFAHLMLNLFIVVLWFILWGFKHKLLAAWAITTYLGANILGFLLNKLLAIIASPTAQPVLDLTLLKLMLLSFLIYICILPNIHRLAGMALMLGVVLLVALRCLAGIQLHTTTLSAIIINFLCAYILIQIADVVYLRQFSQLQRVRLFKHSDFN